MHSERLGRGLRLASTSIGEGLALGEQRGIEEPGASVGGQHQHHTVTRIDGPGDGAGADERLIVRMGVEEHDRAGGHPTIVAAGATPLPPFPRSTVRRRRASQGR